MTIKEEILKKTTAHGQIQDFVDEDGFSQKFFLHILVSINTNTPHIAKILCAAG